jgi:hypothetical protein
MRFSVRFAAFERAEHGKITTGASNPHSRFRSTGSGQFQPVLAVAPTGIDFLDAATTRTKSGTGTIW